jgi:CRP-like cAMP-binding protein
MEKATPQSSLPLGGDIGATAFMQGLTMCRDIPKEAMEAFYAAGVVENYLPDDVVLLEGGTDTDLYVIYEGQIIIGRDTGDEWLILAELDRPAVFGEAAALTEQPRSATARTSTECRLIRIPGAVVRQVAEEAPKLGRRLAALMAARQKDTEKKTS